MNIFHSLLISFVSAFITKDLNVNMSKKSETVLNKYVWKYERVTPVKCDLYSFLIIVVILTYEAKLDRENQRKDNPRENVIYMAFKKGFQNQKFLRGYVYIFIAS